MTLDDRQRKDLAELEQRLADMARALRQAEEELQAANARIADLVRQDPITGLANRRALDERLSVEMMRARRHAWPLSLYIVDVDHFRLVNEQHGHAIGDAVLTAVGRLLCEGVRAVDLVARFGGEEFVVLTPQAMAEDTQSGAERLRAALSASTIPDIGRAVTACFGVAEWDGDEAAEELLQRAGEALHEAKHAGRNRVSVASTTAPDD
jgi:diguanylate cyclase (GGDEF)-like protein